MLRCFLYRVKHFGVEPESHAFKIAAEVSLKMNSNAFETKRIILKNSRKPGIGLTNHS